MQPTGQHKISLSIEFPDVYLFLRNGRKLLEMFIIKRHFCTTDDSQWPPPRAHQQSTSNSLASNTFTFIRRRETCHYILKLLVFTCSYGPCLFFHVHLLLLSSNGIACLDSLLSRYVFLLVCPLNEHIVMQVQNTTTCYRLTCQSRKTTSTSPKFIRK